jgi:hypothetical protein
VTLRRVFQRPVLGYLSKVQRAYGRSNQAKLADAHGARFACDEGCPRPVAARQCARVLCGALVAGLALLSATAAVRPAQDAAPADAYFGLLRISYLEVENRFTDVAIRAGDHTDDPNVYSSADFAADALEDWARAYPRDPQLPRALFLGARAYSKIWIRTYQDRAWAYLQRIVRDYPSSYFGKLVRRQLAIGFTEHYFAEPLPCGSATPAPEPTAPPSPGHPKVAVEPAPCVTPPPTPQPSPTVAPTPTPSPTPSPKPHHWPF